VEQYIKSYNIKVLVINSGSSSLKASLFEINGNKIKNLTDFHIDKIGKINTKQKTDIKNHKEAIKLLFTKIEKKNIEIVGHRVVHGGEKYHKAVKIDAKVIKDIKKLSKLAPLHNPINLESIKICQKFLPKAKHIAVFDTAFHQSIEPKAYLYGLPYSMYEKKGIRRYGFHGSSHKYVISQALKTIRKKNAKIISCHLGNGSSITASINGKSVDTSMGFTPLEGVMMGTRCGSIDPAIAIQLAKKLGNEKANEILNEKSGLKGFSKISSDMREIFDEKSEHSKLTIQILAYQIAKYCGSYAAAMNGLDLLVFTGGIGENAWYIRKQVCQYLKFLGLKLDTKANKINKEIISSTDSHIKVMLIKTDEEKQIAIEAIEPIN